MSGFERVDAGWVAGKGMPSTQTASAFLYLGFFASGFAALLYQVTWQRLLLSFSGSDATSVTIVVSAFLCGLGIGSLLGGVIADRVDRRRAILLFVLFNALISLFALASKLIFYDFIFNELHIYTNSRVTVLLVAFLSVGFPTALMGCSLPLLSKAVTTDLPNAARTISRLYAVDIIGAACGCFITTWFLIGRLGLPSTLWVGAAVSALAAFFGLLSTRGLPAAVFASSSSPDPNSLQRRPLSALIAFFPREPALWAWAGLYFITGFIAVALEILWIRLFFIKYQALSYTFGHILSIYLITNAAGLIVGSATVSRTAKPRTAFCLLQAGAIAYAFCAILVAMLVLKFSFASYAQYQHGGLFEHFKDYRVFFGYENDGITARIGQHFIVMILLPLLVIGPTTFMIGVSFPFVQQAVQQDLGHVGRAVGVVLFANILGNTLGGIVTGLVLFPLIGTRGVLILSLAVAVGFALLASYLTRKPLFVKLGMAAPVIAAAVVGAVLLPSNAQIWQLVTGQAWPAYTELVREDANNVTILVADQKNFSIVVSGHFQGSFPFHLTHVHNGSMGSLVNQSPRRVLDIGFGSGASPYTAGLSPATDHVTVVEIVKGIYELQRTFSDAQGSGPIYRIFRDPRYEFIAGDGRKYLASTRETFDVIIADPLRSVSSGSGFIFSEEYFRLAQSRLAPGGVMVQWIASPRVLAGFKRVFPYGAVFDTTAIGSNSPIVIDKERIRESLRDTKVREYLRAGQIDVDKLVEFATSDPTERWSPKDSSAGPPGNSDLFPRDEFFLGNTYQP